MSKRMTKIDRALSTQQGLFDTTLAEGSLDMLLGLKQLMSREMNGSDRYLVAAQISRLTGRDLSKEMLDKYVASDAAYRPPADMLVAFCHVVSSVRVFRYLLEPLGRDVLEPEDKDLVDLARLQEQHRDIESKMLEIRRKRGLK
ncbi:MAG TPA: hypothetical protein DCP69_07890 [Candidatus Omnitrophica bacterium]|nr:hypothetical protein [Candidatus Omnitrophota bacterium]